jgi:hypothetical protein
MTFIDNKNKKKIYLEYSDKDAEQIKMKYMGNEILLKKLGNGEILLSKLYSSDGILIEESFNKYSSNAVLSRNGYKIREWDVNISVHRSGINNFYSFVDFVFGLAKNGKQKEMNLKKIWNTLTKILVENGHMEMIPEWQS